MDAICVCVCVCKKNISAVYFSKIFCDTFESPITLFSGDADVVPMKRDADTTWLST